MPTLAVLRRPPIRLYEEGLRAAAYAYHLGPVVVGEHRGPREALDYRVREDELEEFGSCKGDEVASCLGAPPAHDTARKVSPLDLPGSAVVPN